jgi:beta-lactamase class A
MSPAGRRTSAFYIQRKRQQRIHQIQTAVFTTFCLCIIGFALYRAAHRTTTTSTTTSASVTSAPTHSAMKTSTPSQDAQLSQILTTWSKKYSFNATVSVQELTGEQRYASLNATNRIVTASTFKLYVAYGALHAIEQGKYTSQTVTKDGNTISEDLTDMIVNSDNDAARTLGFMIGWPQIDNLLASQGMTHTDTNNYVGTSTTAVGDKYSTAKDLSLFLQKLYKGQLLNDTNTQLLLTLLKKQTYRSGIPAGVPSGIAVADKPGWLTPADGIYEYVENDAGIVYGSKSAYVLVITTTGKSWSPLADLSKQVYAYLQS